MRKDGLSFKRREFKRNAEILVLLRTFIVVTRRRTSFPAYTFTAGDPEGIAHCSAQKRMVSAFKSLIGMTGLGSSAASVAGMLAFGCTWRLHLCTSKFDHIDSEQSHERCEGRLVIGTRACIEGRRSVLE